MKHDPEMAKLAGQLCRLLGWLLTGIMLTNIGSSAGFWRVTRVQERKYFPAALVVSG